MPLAETGMKASDLLVKALENEGVEYIFGVPGEENLDFVESLRQSKIRLVVTRHEQGAGFMAATLGRLTGHSGVCLSTLGPGATNFLTAAAYAHLGAFPMIMITGNIRSTVGQKPILKSKQGSFQILDVVNMQKPVTKLAKQIVHGGLIPSLTREAFRIAEEERPGAAHLELPEDIAAEIVPESESYIHFHEKVRRPIAEDKAIAKALVMIKEAKHPLLLIAAGANRKITSNMLRQFVDQTGMPFCNTQMGKGVVDERHKCFMGTAAISSSDYIHACIDHADLILMVGHDVVEKPPFFMNFTDNRKVVHINYFGAQVDQVYFPHLEVVGDIGNAIWRLKEGLKEETGLKWDLRYFNYVKENFEEHLKVGVDLAVCPVTPPFLLSELRRAIPEDGVVCLDNGLYKVWFARNFKAYRQNTILLDNALATMGAGLPSAMATKLIWPDRVVVAVCGDGGFMMNSQELATAVMMDLHMTVLVLNDNAYGMIKWKQTGANFEDFGLDLTNPDFVKYAESYGAKGYRVETAAQLSSFLQHSFKNHGVHLIEIPFDYALSSILQVPALKAHLSATLKTPKDFFAEAGPQVEEKEEIVRPTSKPEKKISENVKQYPFYLANKAEEPNHDLEVYDKYTGEVAYQVALAHAPDIDRAIEAAVKATPAMAALSSWQKKEILDFCVMHFKDRFEELAMALCIEAGKPIKDSRGEVGRLIDTFTIAAEETSRMYGEYTSLDISKRTNGFKGIVKGFPIGPVSMISPFNFPLNLAAHKIAPALAVGCPFVVKPASRTPIGALIIGILRVSSGWNDMHVGEILSQAPHLPLGAFSVLPCSREGADLFTIDERFKLLSFTGSPGVGWPMKARAGKKRVVLELGGNAACVVEDIKNGGAEIESMIAKIIHGAFYQSGQSCISVQRLLVRHDHYTTFKSRLIDSVSKLKIGDPKDEDTFIGPLIAESEAMRIEKWVNEAVDDGAHILMGGKRNGAFYDATIVENVKSTARLYREEAFGPVLIIEPYSQFSDAVAKVNDSDFGLQTGIFTHDMDKAFYAFEHLDVGGVVLNHVPSVRVDSQPYGGVKDSGFGREGIRWAMKDMVEERVLVMVDVGDKSKV